MSPPHSASFWVVFDVDGCACRKWEPCMVFLEWHLASFWPSIALGVLSEGQLCVASAWAFDDFSWISLKAQSLPRSWCPLTRSHRNCRGVFCRLQGLWRTVCSDIALPSSLEGCTLDPLSLTILSTPIGTSSFRNLSTQLGTTFCVQLYPELQRAHVKCFYKSSLASDGL